MPRSLVSLALALLPILALASAAPGEEAADAADGPAADGLAAAQASLALCSDGGSRSPAEVAAAADAAERSFAALLEAAPLAAHVGLARTLIECRIAAAPMMEQARLMVRIEEHLQAALALAPGHYEAHLYYGLLLAHVPPFLERSEDAVVHLEAALAAAATAGIAAPVDLHLALGDLHRRQGRPAAADDAWRRGLAEHPGDGALRQRLEADAPPETTPPPAASPETAAPEAAAPEAGSPEAASPETGSPEAGSPTDPRDTLRRLAALVRRHLAPPGVPGIAVAVSCGGRDLLVAGFGLADVENDVAMTADSVVRIGSLSKQIAAVVAFRLAEEGVVDLDGALSRLLPGAEAEGIRLVHLLTHTAGLPRDVVDSADWVKDSLAAPRPGAPGERYAYSNLGYALLGRALEAAAGEPLPALLDRLAIAPAGLAATGPCDDRRIVRHRADGYSLRAGTLERAAPLGDSAALLAAGGLCSTARDLLRWQRALHGGRLLSGASYRRLVTPPEVADPAGTTYAAGLRVRHADGRRVLRHSGAGSGFLAEAAYHPDLDLAVVVVANSDAARPIRLAEELAREVRRGGDGPCSVTLPA